MVDATSPDSTSDPMEPFYDYFNFGDDRAMGIALPSILENLVEQLIRFKLIPDKEILSEFFRPSGPLGNFGAKIRMAVLLNMMDKNTYKDFSIIAKIRNKFAHDLDTKDFNNPVISEWLKSMSLYKSLVAQRDAGFIHISDPAQRVAAKLIYEGNLSNLPDAYKMCIRAYASLLYHVIEDMKKARASIILNSKI